MSGGILEENSTEISERIIEKFPAWIWGGIWKRNPEKIEEEIPVDINLAILESIFGRMSGNITEGISGEIFKEILEGIHEKNIWNNSWKTPEGFTEENLEILEEIPRVISREGWKLVMEIQGESWKQFSKDLGKKCKMTSGWNLCKCIRRNYWIFDGSIKRSRMLCM